MFQYDISTKNSTYSWRFSSSCWVFPIFTFRSGESPHLRILHYWTLRISAFLPGDFFLFCASLVVKFLVFFDRFQWFQVYFCLYYFSTWWFQTCSNMFHFYPPRNLGNWSNLKLLFFQMGWNHHLAFHRGEISRTTPNPAIHKQIIDWTIPKKIGKGITWRIIPVSKWLVTIASFRPLTGFVLLPNGLA